MSKVHFITPSVLPLDAFTHFGINAKPNSVSPFGFFGTGLKYAVSIILRLGGKFQLFVKGVEYEFYLYDKEFRGKDFKQVRMRKRKLGKLTWSKSTALPFTTELGKNWELWQAFRELESNTRDENGCTHVVWDSMPIDIDEKGTSIIIELDGFADCYKEDTKTKGDAEVSSSVFLGDDLEDKVIFQDDLVCIYDRPTDAFYYQGIRVYEPRLPCRYTYDFKPGVIQLSEDRTAKNVWTAQYFIAIAIQKIKDKDALKFLTTKDKDVSWFEHDELTVYEGTSTKDETKDYRSAVAVSVTSGSVNVPRSTSGYYREYMAPVAVTDKIDISLTLLQWRMILETMEERRAMVEDDDAFESATKLIKERIKASEKTGDIIPF